MITLRDYQQSAVEAVRASFASRHRRVCFVMPTGAGKTVVASYITENAVGRGNPVLILAHRIELIDQLSASLTVFGIQHGVIAAGRSMNGMPVQVGMIGTVARRLDRIPAPSLIVIDEAHHATASTYRKIIDAFRG